MRKILVMILFFAVLLGIANAAEAYKPNCGHLKGFIYKPDGKKPLWGAQVALQNVETEMVFRSDVTDSSGDYRLLNIPAGDYMILILARERPYKVKKIDFLIKIFPGKTTFISFSLKRAVKGLFFLFEPCCLAMIVTGTALGRLPPPSEASPPIPKKK